MSVVRSWCLSLGESREAKEVEQARARTLGGWHKGEGGGGECQGGD